ncbi:hypothetical protein G3I34_05595 [Streptomyces sp. SID8014]|uniref:hypothetical protein n=1 Tax=Streptomyces sp. SID8014 TaxID=2706097 RepID=UPI0013BB9318|nr:hypothetical protein [Streptomyces sp. SID8014]
MSGVSAQADAEAARAGAVAVLRTRGRAAALALLPAALAVVLLAGGPTGVLTGTGWDAARALVCAVAVLVLLAAAAVALAVARARPAVSPTVPVTESSAPDLHRLVRDLADRLEVPAPSAIALTPDCDSWLEDRSHPALGAEAVRPAHDQAPPAPVLVIGSPFLWWMRVAELRAVLAPVVAGTGPSAQPDILAARRFVRGLDAAAALGTEPDRGPLARLVLGGTGRVARLLLRACREEAAEMERAVAATSSERAKTVDYGLRIAAQEQIGLAYAGWDRLLNRVALPAWRTGRWPSRLDAGVVAALTELSRRDRLADDFTTRLGERPACDLLEEPGTVDEATSLLAARLFHGEPAGRGPEWLPVDWEEYADEVVDRTWRTEAARLHRILDELGVPDGGRPDGAEPGGATLDRVLEHLAVPAGTAPAGPGHLPELTEEELATASDDELALRTGVDIGGGAQAARSARPRPAGVPQPGGEVRRQVAERAEQLASALAAEVAREEAGVPAVAPAPVGQGADETLWAGGRLPLCPLQPPRTGRELLAEHVVAMVCCSAMDTAGARPGLDWLDGPVLLVRGRRVADLGGRVAGLVEHGDGAALRAWAQGNGVRSDKPVRLV